MGRELSVNKAFSDFKSLGVSTSRESLSDLLDYFEEAYLLVRVRERSRSLSANPRSVSKIYAADPGLVAAYSPSAATDVGKRLETAVCNALRRRAGLTRKDHVTRLLLGSGSSRREVDFAVGDVLLDEPPELVQAAVSLGDGKTRKRELSALDAAMGAFGTGEAWVVTLDDEEEVQRDSGTVHVVPALLLAGDMSAYKGAIAENMVATSLVSAGYEPYYYHATSGSPEIDFALSYRGGPTLVECKSTDGRMTSMRYVLGHPQKYGEHPAIKFADTNVGGGDGFTALPLYALGFLEEPQVDAVPEPLEPPVLGA